MINNLQSKRLVSRQEYEDNYDRIFRKTDFETMRKVGDCAYWIKTHPELSEQEVCEMYGLDYNIYKQYKEE